MIGSKIKAWRIQKNLSQEHLAEELSLSQSSYSRLEANETDCTYSRIVQIAKILGLTPEELICGNQTTFSLTHNQNASGITVNQSKDYRDDYIKTLKEQLKLMQRVIEEALIKKKPKTK